MHRIPMTESSQMVLPPADLKRLSSCCISGTLSMIRFWRTLYLILYIVCIAEGVCVVRIYIDPHVHL